MPTTLTDDERRIMLALMQAGTRTFTGQQFDEAAASYLYLREKVLAIAAASKAEVSKAEASKAEAA